MYLLILLTFIDVRESANFEASAISIAEEIHLQLLHMSLWLVCESFQIIWQASTSLQRLEEALTYVMLAFILMPFNLGHLLSCKPGIRRSYEIIDILPQPLQLRMKSLQDYKKFEMWDSQHQHNWYTALLFSHHRYHDKDEAELPESKK